MSEYGVLLIGGRRTHQEAHGPIFANHPRCGLVGVAAEPAEPDFRKGSGRELAEQLGVPYFADMDAALARDDVHVVSSTPHVERRGDVLVSCIEAGKHVYMDKPLAGSLEAIDAIAAAAARADVKTQMFSQNLAPWVQEVRQAVEDDAVGEVVSVHAENIFAKGRAGSVLPGAVRREKSPVERYTFAGAKREMFDVGVYSLALVHMLTGRAVESVFALTGNYFFADHEAVDVEDFGAMALRLEGGVTATAVGGRFGWSSHPRSGPQRIAVVGTKGTLSAEVSARRVEVYNAEPDFTPPEVDPLDPMGMWFGREPEYVAMPKRRWVSLDPSRDTMAIDAAHFIDCIDNDVEPELNAAAAAGIAETILGGYESAARGEEVSLPLPRD